MESAPGRTVPEKFRGLDSITTEDPSQYENDAFFALRYLRPAINYYLSEMIFAKKLLEFPQKLSDSPWSIAVTKSQGHPTIGFSGTNDANRLLPLGVEPIGLGEQKHTNALVLNCLLHPDNEVQDIREPLPAVGPRSSPHHSGPPPANEILHHVARFKPKIRAILDAGAQIVGLGNGQAARCWLELVPDEDIRAAIFFNAAEDLCVVERDGTTEPFLTSSYVTNTAAYIVFLDQAHTRGTDLRLPNHYRAAVTLGPGLTKDRLMQACMRMRQLGKDQSVVFLVSAEMRRSITRLCNINESSEIKVADVLYWAVCETWRELERLAPLWATHDIRRQRQQLLWDRAGTDRDKTCDPDRRYRFEPRTAAQFLESESQTLRERYHPSQEQARPTLTGEIANLDAALDAKGAELAQIRERCLEFGVDSLATSASHEEHEHEHELQVQREEERQHASQELKPYQSSLHQDVEAFVVTGVIPVRFDSFYARLQRAGRQQHQPPPQAPRSLPFDLLATVDFTRTVHPPEPASAGPGWVSDEYQRPVQ
ncbi:hypothetical protein B0T24DRAFT_368004 [Lasiosphaeria ovina]|uniref:ubiquitinyl hydrolase 1 n=1 Tax=Lasiosphaeria ovina TaxID=92902 RepID=A0AAE0JZ88_9PEZI|nr:hypothetical protein B0T24DRAFT_368004 [Lasiosphaeria ovina]